MVKVYQYTAFTVDGRMAITITDDGGTIKSDEMMLAEVQAAISACMTAGESYTIFGARSIVRSLPELRSMEMQYRKRVMLKKGWVPRNQPDFSGTSYDDLPVT